MFNSIRSGFCCGDNSGDNMNNNSHAHHHRIINMSCGNNKTSIMAPPFQSDIDIAGPVSTLDYSNTMIL